jgi:hypothetical protein
MPRIRSHVGYASWRYRRLLYLHCLRSSATWYDSYKRTDAYVHSLDL